MALFKRSSGSGETRHVFWERLAAKLGTPITAHALGRYLSGARERGPLWGIFYITADTLYFHHFAQRSWLSSLTTLGTEDEELKRPAQEREVIMSIPLGTIVEFVRPPVRSWLGRIVHGDEGQCQLRREEGLGEPFDIAIEQNPESFFDEIERGITRTRQS